MRKSASRISGKSVQSVKSVQPKKVFGVESLEQRLLMSTTTSVAADLLDRSVASTGALGKTTDTTVRVGDNGTNASEQVIIIPFKLPSLPAGATITSANLSVYLAQLANSKSLAGSIDVYGLGRRATNTVLASDYFEGAYGTDATDATAIQTGLASKTSTVGTLGLNASGISSLTSYLNAQYANGAGANQYVFLRLNAESDQLKSRYWKFATANASTVSQKPSLSITFDVPVIVVTPAAPSNLALQTTSASTIAVSWQDNSTNETAFEIERSTDGTSFSSAGTVGEGVTSFNDSGLAADTRYFYRVHALNGTVKSTDTAVLSDTTLPSFTHTLWVDSAYAGTTHTGTLANPYSTVASAMTAAVAGDGIVLRGGTYRETVTVKSGTTGAPITVMGAPNERAIISGFAAITGWTLVGGSTYSTTLTYNPTSLFVGNDPQDLARTPNEGWWGAPTVTQNAAAGTTTISDPAHLAGVASLVGGYAQAHINSGNVYGGAKIIAHDTVAGTITTTTISGLASGDRYIVKNTNDLLDRPGEWTVKDNGNGTFTVYFWANNVADLAATQTRKMTGRQVFVSGGHDIVIRGLEITGNTGYGVDIEKSGTTKANNVLVRDCVIHNNGSNGVWLRYATNITLSHNEVLANANGITMADVVGVLVDGNEVAYNGVDGIDLAGDVSGKQPGDAGFDPSSNIIVSNNYIHHHLGYGHADGIQTYRWLTDVHILNNFILDNCQGIMTEEIDGVELGGNIIWNAAGFIVIMGHSNSNNWNVHNNTIGGAGYGPYNITGVGNNMTENITTSQVGIPSIVGSAYTGDRNLYFSQTGGAPLRTASPSKNYTSIATFFTDTGQDQHSAIGDPQFVNAPLYETVMNNIQTSTATTLNLRSVTGFAVGDHIQINSDGVVRTVTSVDTAGSNITFDVPLPAKPLTQYMMVEDWKTNTNFTLDLSLKSTSPAKTMGASGGQIGGLFSTVAYAKDDFNNDGTRDTPIVAQDIINGLPDPNNWPPPTY